eukprot:3134742-Prymnesium_polylepis.1
MPAAVSKPLSSSARPAEAGRAHGRTRRTTWRRFARATFLCGEIHLLTAVSKLFVYCTGIVLIPPLLARSAGPYHAGRGLDSK